MDAFTDPEVEEIWFCKPTQVGGSECLHNMMGYVIAQDPVPTMAVYPTQDFAKSYSKTRIQPMIDLCPTLKGKYLFRESEDRELHFTDMNLHFAAAESARDLAGTPICYLFLDEVDKYPRIIKDEADPINLARQRTGTFPGKCKIVGGSTPTVKTGNIWKMRERANEVRKFFVPCPHCGHYQDLKFGQVKWPEGSTPDDARDLAWYECEKCAGRITDAHKTIMVRTGEWRAVEHRGSGRSIVWFHLNSLYSPWVRIGEMAQKFLASKDYPEELRNFVNSWLAEPWEDASVQLSRDLVMERRTEFEEGVVPGGALILTAGVDVQQDCMSWTIRAWGPLLTSWNIAHGMALSWADIEEVMNRPYRKRNGEEFLVSLVAVDSGDQTDEVYDFCAINSEWAVPVKGANNPMLARFKLSTIDKVSSKAYGMRLVIVDGAQYKSMIASRMSRPNGRGSWMVHAGCDEDYAEQVTSEQRVREMRGAREVEVWKKKSTHAANHYLDAEVYCACAADLMQVRYLDDPEQSRPDDAKPATAVQKNKQAGNWLDGGKWL